MRPGTDGRFGAELQRQREARHLSQSQLGAATGYEHSYISRLEAGKRTPSRDTVAALCDVLESSWAEQCQLFTAAGYLPPGDWVALDGWLIRPMTKQEEIDNAVRPARASDQAAGQGLS